MNAALTDILIAAVTLGVFIIIAEATWRPLCRVVMVVSGVVDGEVSGVVIGDTQDDDYISSQELAAGVVYIVVGVGKLATTQPAGVVVLPEPPQP